MADLRGRLEEHKIKKARKMERRAKWENWRKTQEMFYRKTSTNYKKWDVFESDSVSENEDDKEPIVPENDPAFKAMEMDFEDRAKKRKRNRKEANRLKELGNDCMKKGLYKSANHHYSAALEEAKDMLVLYNNRALARIKLEMWQDVIDDTTRVLEYCEVFD
jgi:tetratricopeptide (TPR) repeat protein